MRSYQRGVTLVELMVVMVIIAILMAVAVPSYRQYTIRANRADAHTVLMQIAASQERAYLQGNTYSGALSDAPPDGLGIAATSERGHYALAITAADANAFAAVATATGTQAEDTDCAVLAINSRGVRYGGPGPAFAANNDPRCW